ncbi:MULTISPECIES: tripartite tricarboxylate transporter TctB family protein [Basfia]|uniref:DUF1468 domain-containing protein n=1 Tax=Mannheimia succiniciproducens (strain KCTC 0769BP / MBEL55E) TaxID=221988 RepID=Q65VX3_MANSM|nr:MULTISPECIES: tripartite tricarboxylate transporter TctB family protein [Basfia]AAU36887.1 unknown [[Mannheimia] succiniciproducens MBEL55E]SEQ75076.1 Tripartite tricarboxylate transporter TctB family protein [Basfia succiniciproducens]
MFRLITPIALFFFGLFVSIYSYQSYGDFAEYGAAFYPTAVGVLVSFFSLVDFIMELRIKDKYVFQHFDFFQDGKIILLIIAIISFYIFVADYLGFIITTSLILIFLTLPFLEKYKLLTALLLIILSIGIYLLFARVLLVGLPSGIIFE